MTSFPPEELYYLTRVENLPFILDKGILSYELYEKTKLSNLPRTPILNKKHDQKVFGQRKNAKPTPDGRCLLDYTSLYLQPRNPMMYGVLHSKKRGAKTKDKPVIISISKEVLGEPGVFVTDGDATDDATVFYAVSKGKKIPNRLWKTVQNDWWNDADGSKRKLLAECLVPGFVKPAFISSILTADPEALNLVKQTVGDCPIPIVKKPEIFFQPKSRIQRGSNIFLVDNGDMFFSSMQTLTVTVNLQGIMGKGLALRAKHQFPDVYVNYQKACRDKQIRAGRPYLYMREKFFDEELADRSLPTLHSNTRKWFLLFPTKRHWRDDSRLEDIEDALKWVQKNYREKDIKSLALPALGCGLGKLCLNEVIPLMCEHLHGIGIEVEIYLPRDIRIDSQDLDKLYSLADYAIGKQLPLFKRNLE